MEPSARRTRWALVWALTVTVGLLFAWERVAAGFDDAGRVMEARGNVFVDASGNDRIADFFAKLPSPRAPRIAVLGSSQMVVVKDGDSSESVAWQLEERLRPGVEVVGLAAGGQQVMESMAVLLAGWDKIQPSRVVIGLGLFSMTRATLRESIAQSVDSAIVRADVARLLPGEADAALAAAVPGPSEKAVARGETVQQKADRSISAWLGRHLAMVQNRRALRTRLVDEPLRRDLITWLGRRFGGRKTARTYRITPAYELSLDALSVIALRCREAGVPLDVVLVPFDATREPVPYAPETQARVAADLRARTDAAGASLLDLSAALVTEHFGDYVDGSPDGFHFDAAGHAQVAGSIASHIQEPR